MEQYSVTGMSCAACQARVEKAVSGVPGVETCSVSLLTNSMGVEGTASAEEIIQAVEKAGYGAKVKVSEEELLKDRETPKLRKRLIASVCFLFVLMYFSMGHHMLGLPVPGVVEESMAVNGMIQMVLALVVMFINRQFFISGFKSLASRAPNMDTLVAMGSAVAFAWSTAELIRGSGDFYFETAAMIVTLITIGKMLETMSKGRTTDALKSLMKLAPKTVTIYDDGAEKTVPVEDVRVGDIFIVKPGENVPVDGVIIEGSTAVNEAALTGEGIPVDKEPGDQISAATLNQSGYIRAKATRAGVRRRRRSGRGILLQLQHGKSRGARQRRNAPSFAVSGPARHPRSHRSAKNCSGKIFAFIHLRADIGGKERRAEGLRLSAHAGSFAQKQFGNSGAV